MDCPKKTIQQLGIPVYGLSYKWIFPCKPSILAMETMEKIMKNPTCSVHVLPYKSQNGEHCDVRLASTFRSYGSPLDRWGN